MRSCGIIAGAAGTDYRSARMLHATLHPNFQCLRTVPVAIYTRVSTDGQTGHRFDSCEHQANVCREYIGKKNASGWFEFGLFSDEAYSGASLDRPGIRRLLQCIAAGQVSVLLIYRLERILRSISEWTRLQEFLQEHRCKLLSPTEDHSDTSASGRLKTNMMMSFAEYERTNVAEKTRSKLLAQARRGMWGGGYIPFGYSYDREKQELRPNPVEALIVQKIFQRAAEMHSVHHIARELNAAGHRTGVRWMKDPNYGRRSVGQRLFRPEMLKKLIANPLYRGAIRFDGNEFKGRHEALVSLELWENANALVAEGKRRQPPRLRKQDKYSNMLKGLAYCAASETVLYSGASGKLGAGGRIYRYYTCSRRRGPDHDCLLGSIPAEPLESVVVGFLSRMATDAATLELLCGCAPSIGMNRQRKQVELADTTRELDRIAKEVSNCIDAISGNGAAAITEELSGRIVELRARKQKTLFRQKQLQQKLHSLDVVQFDRERVHGAAERLGRLLPAMDATKQTTLVRGLVTRVDVQCVAHAQARDERGRAIRIGLLLRADRPLEAMERDAVIYEQSEPMMPFTGGTVEFELKAIFRARGQVEVTAPFAIQIGDEQRRESGAVAEIAQHPIHRATRWQLQLPGASVRSIASMERVSPSLVSLHLKLLRLTPEIQIFVRELITPRAIHHFSLRRMAVIADLDRDQQLAKFAELRADFPA